MKEIILRHGEKALVDDDDYEQLMKLKWYKGKDGYALHMMTFTYKKKYVSCCVMCMHRVVNKTKDGLETDHIDGNRLNNQKCNLRNATREENQHNAKIRQDNTSGYKGVWRNYDKWTGQIQFQNKRQTIGRFDTKEEAAIAYNSKAKELFGEYAWLNNIPDRSEEQS